MTTSHILQWININILQWTKHGTSERPSSISPIHSLITMTWNLKVNFHKTSWTSCIHTFTSPSTFLPLGNKASFHLSCAVMWQICTTRIEQSHYSLKLYNERHQKLLFIIYRSNFSFPLVHKTLLFYRILYNAHPKNQAKVSHSN